MNDSATVLWLEEVTQHDRAAVGGKGAHLGEMARAGFPVPPGFCITTSAYLDFVVQNDLQEAIAGLEALAGESDTAALEREMARLRALFAEGKLARSVEEQIIAAYTRLVEVNAPHGQVAVRSSATAEDLADASFAGQQETYLYVSGAQKLLTGVKSCWASLWTPPAISYRHRFWAGRERVAMAVVVQAMIPCDVAGVAFSVDPLTGQAKVTIEANWGQGEAVVRGEVETDCYLVERTPEGVSSDFSTVLGYKAHQRVRNLEGGEGTILADVPLERRDQLTLSSGQVGHLAETVLALEKHFGTSQDVEWGFWREELYIFQTRPLTVHGASWFTDSIVGDDYMWTSGFLNERFSEPVSPLGWCVVRELLEELAFRQPLRYMGYPQADSLPVTKLYRAYPFVNETVFQILYKPLPDFLLPEDAYRYFPGGDTSLRKKAGYPPSVCAPRLLASLLWAFLRDPLNWSPWHNYRQWDNFTLKHQRVMAAISAQVKELKGTAGVSLKEFWRIIEQAQALNRRLLALHRWSLTHADLTYSVLRRLAAAWLGMERGAQVCAALALGLPNKSLELNQELHKLAAVPPGQRYEAALAAFLDRYGHRSFSLDMWRPNFAADPAQVTELVQSLAAGHGGLDTDDQIRQKERAYDLVRQSMASGLVGKLKLTLFDHVLNLARRYMPLREDQRFYWQQTLAAMREVLLMIGEGLVASGLLNEPKEIFFATKHEIETYLKGQEDFPTHQVWRREREFRLLQSQHQLASPGAYPTFLVGNRPLDVDAEKGQVLVGRPVSPGLKHGPVKVVGSPRQLSKICSGDILVTGSTDPAWTPIFGLVGGLIMERGGQLSHGAVVAREYGLPAVTGVAGATQLLHDGQEVLLDGLAGTVTLLN